MPPLLDFTKTCAGFGFGTLARRRMSKSVPVAGGAAAVSGWLAMPGIGAAAGTSLPVAGSVTAVWPDGCPLVAELEPTTRKSFAFHFALVIVRRSVATLVRTVSGADVLVPPS